MIKNSRQIKGYIIDYHNWLHFNYSRIVINIQYKTRVFSVFNFCLFSPCAVLFTIILVYKIYFIVPYNCLYFIFKKNLYSRKFDKKRNTYHINEYRVKHSEVNNLF